jgi:hypothetical protein
MESRSAPRGVRPREAGNMRRRLATHSAVRLATTAKLRGRFRTRWTGARRRLRVAPGSRDAPQKRSWRYPSVRPIKSRA